MPLNDNPFLTFVVSFYSIAFQVYLESFDTLLTHCIQYAIGILTILYLIKKLKQTNKNKMNIFKRLGSDTPKFFRTIRNIGMVLTAVSGTLLAAPVALPAAIITAAGYLATGGAVAAAIAQTVYAEPKENNDQNILK